MQHVPRGLRLDPHVLVGQRRIVDARDDGRLHVLEPLEAVQRRVGLHGDQPDAGSRLAQPTARSHEGPARAQSRDEVGDRPVGLLEELGPGRLVVRAPVGRITVLIRVEVGVRVLGVELLRHADRSVGSLQGAGPHHVGPVDAEQALSLLGDARRDAELDGISERRAEHGVRDPGIAGRRVEQGAAGPERPRAEAVEDHRGGRAVLHGSAGVLRFELGVDLDARMRLEPAETHQRGIADERPDGGPRCLPDGIGRSHDGGPLCWILLCRSTMSITRVSRQ